MQIHSSIHKKKYFAIIQDIRELYQLAEEIIIGERIEADGDDDEGQDGGEGTTVGA